jgi:hypothetical protein
MSLRSLLSSYEQAEAAVVVRQLIVSSGQTATLLRRQDEESLYGVDEGTFVEVCVFPVWLNATPPVDLSRKVDATASVLPDLDVRVTDRVRVSLTEYRVQAVVEESLFGVVTHKTLELVLLDGS